MLKLEPALELGSSKYKSIKSFSIAYNMPVGHSFVGYVRFEKRFWVYKSEKRFMPVSTVVLSV